MYQLSERSSKMSELTFVDPVCLERFTTANLSM